MRSCGSSSSPTAHITFCTLTEVLRPQILIMAPPYARLGQPLCCPGHSSLRLGRKQAARGGARQASSGQHVQVVKPVAKNSPKTRKLRPRLAPAREGCARTPHATALAARNKKARERVSPGLLGAALVNTLFWKILVTRVKWKCAAGQNEQPCGRPARS